MPTQTLSANSNLSALTFASGDTIQTGAFTLTIDMSATVNLCWSSAAGRIVVASGSFTITGTMSVTGGLSGTGAALAIAVGQSLTHNGVMAMASQAVTIPLLSVTGGTLVLNAGASSTYWLNASGSLVFFCSQTGGVISLTGSLAFNGYTGFGQWGQSGGTWTQNGNCTVSATGGFVINLNGAAAYTLNGLLSSIACNFSGVGAINVNGASVVATFNGDVSIDGGAGAGNFGVYVNATGATVTLNGNCRSSNGAYACYAQAGTLVWSGSRSLAASNSCQLMANYSGAINLSNLILSNSGTVCITRVGGGTITTNGTTAINNQTSTAQAAVYGASVAISNTPSTVGYLPTAGQVQNGVAFGYVGAMLVGTGATIDINALSSTVSAAVLAAVGTGSGLTSLAQASTVATNQTALLAAIGTPAQASTLASDLTSLLNAIGTPSQASVLATDETALLAAIGTPAQASALAAALSSVLSAVGTPAQASVLSTDLTSLLSAIGTPLQASAMATYQAALLAAIGTPDQASALAATQSTLLAAISSAVTAIEANSSSTVTAFSPAALLAIRTAFNGVVATVVGPVQSPGGQLTIKLTVGDDYSAADSRAIVLDLDGTVLPDLTNATIQLCLSSGSRVIVTGVATVPTGATRVVQFQPTGTDTGGLIPKPQGVFAVKITVSGREITPLDGRGTLIVLPKVA